LIFLNPEFLYLLILLSLFFGYLLIKKQVQAEFFSADIMKKLRVNSKGLSLRFRNILFFFVGFLMIVALAQPVINDGTIEVKAKSADIMIALDISDSMLAEDIYPNRLKFAKQKALSLLKFAPNERIGIVAFAKESYLVSPLSFDHKAVSFLLRQLDTTSITQQGTDILSILDVVGNSKSENSKKYLLILSDGGDKKDFSKEIQKAKESNIVVFVLAIATKKGAPIKLKDGTFIKQHGDIIISRLNENIADLATKSGGVYIQSTKSHNDVKTMLREIEKSAVQKELKTQEIQKNIPLFYYPLSLALILLLIATSSMFRVKKVISSFALLPLVFCFVGFDARAGVFDFMDLSNAKNAYENRDYKKSAKIYKRYADENADANSYYNAGNSYYKQKEYKKALNAYEKAGFKDKNLEANRLSNMGNAYAKQADMNSLQKAVEAYEKSLKIKEDKNTRENLEEVKKLLKKNNQKKDDKNKQNQNKDKKDSDKNSDSKDNQNSKNKDSKDKNSKDKKESDAKQDSDKKSDSKDKKDSSKSRKSKDNKNNSDDMKSKKESQDDKKEDLKKLSKEKGEKKDIEKKESNQEPKQASQSKKQAKHMSDAEEKKWLKALNAQKNTYMYKLGEQKPQEDNTDEKPW